MKSFIVFDVGRVQKIFKNDYADGKKSLTREVLKFLIETVGRVVHGSDAMTEKRVYPPIVAALERDVG
jgi:hypothetical protein